jgi:pimeloyl-ACP methyl ester carboxylesterase
MPTIDSSDGTAISYNQSGEGEPLLLVHGILSDRTVFERLERRLAKRFTVYSFDRRGRGESGAIGSSGLEAQYGDVVALLDSIGQPTHVFAHSLGSYVALGASSRSELVRTLAMYEPPPAMPMLSDIATQLGGLVEAGKPEAAVAALLGSLGATEEMLGQLQATPFWPLMTSLASTIAPELEMLATFEPDEDALGAVKMPVLLMRGSETPDLVKSVCDVLVSVLPSSRVVELEGQDHFAPNLAPAVVEEAFLAFVDAGS